MKLGRFEIDAVNDLIKQAKEAGWKAPSDHPDLVATHETSRLHKLFAGLQHDAESQAMAADYQRVLKQSIEQSQQLDAAVQAGKFEQASTLFGSLQKSCKECHVAYRDK